MPAAPRDNLRRRLRRRRRFEHCRRFRHHLVGGGENTEIVAAAGDAVTVGSALTYVNAEKGATTIVGGSGTSNGTVEGAAGYNTNILAGSGDVIALNGASAYIDATAGSTTITGGAGKAHVEVGKGNSIHAKRYNLPNVCAFR